MLGPERRAALREPGGDGDVVGERHPGQPPLHHAVRHLQVLPARAGKPAHEEPAFHLSGQAAHELGDVPVLRIGVDDREIRRRPAALERDVVDIGRARHSREHVEGVRLEVPGHRRDRRLVEILPPAGADADADGADPVGNAGPAPEQREDIAEVVGQQVRYVEEAEVRRALAQLRDAGFRGVLPVLRGCVPVAEIRHQQDPSPQRRKDAKNTQRFISVELPHRTFAIPLRLRVFAVCI